MYSKSLGILFLLSAVGLLGLFAWDAFFARSSRKQLESPFQGDWEEAPVEEELLEPDDAKTQIRELVNIAPNSLAKRRLTRIEWDAYVARRNYTLTTAEGDTWTALADKYLGDASLKQHLFDANPNLDPRLPLKLNQDVVIPFRYRQHR